MIVAQLTILAVWLGLWFVFFGWGLIATKIARCARTDGIALLVTPWLGVACVIAFLQIGHLAVPVDGRAIGTVSVVGILGLLLFGRRFGSLAYDASRTHPVATAFVAITVVWLSNRALNTQEYTDHGLYYMNAIRWMTDYRIIPGLANVHSRLAFNNSNFLLNAMLEAGVWRGYSAHFVNGFLAALAVPIVVWGGWMFVNGSRRDRLTGTFLVSLAMVLAVSVIDRRISSAHPDFIAAMMVTIAAWRLLAIQLIEDESQGQQLNYNLLSIALLGTTAVTIKLTVIFFVVLAGIALCGTLYLLARARGARPPRAVFGQLLFMLPWVLLLFVPWVVRGYIMSGYPLFPSTFAGLPVDWLYPAKDAQVVRDGIYAWNRTYYGNRDIGYEPGWGWFMPWLKQVIILRGEFDVVAPAAVSLICLIAITLRGKRSRSAQLPDDLPASTWLLAAAYAVSIVAWFFTAPSPRMGNFALWGLAAMLLILASNVFLSDRVMQYSRLIIAGLIVFLMLPMVDQAVRVETRYRTNPNLPEFGHHFYDYYPFVISTWGSGFPPIPTSKLVKETSKYGAVVYLGEPRADGKSPLVWDSPLPAEQYLNPELELRHANDLQAGFESIKSADSDNETSTTRHREVLETSP
jgi:hypothetical protein